MTTLSLKLAVIRCTHERVCGSLFTSSSRGKTYARTRAREAGWRTKPDVCPNHPSEESR